MSNIIELKIMPTRELYFNDDSSYGIYACETKQNKLVKLNTYNNISVKGNTMRLRLDNEYNAKLIEKEDKKYGVYYEIASIFDDIPTDINKQRDYLANIITKRQVDSIFRAYPNHDVIDLIKNDQIDLNKVKGIGKKTYVKIKDKIIQNLEYQQAYEFLSKYDVTNNMIIKLVKHFKSAGLLIKKMEANPYCITEVSGIGFLKADKIALNMGYDANGEYRIVSAIEYVVEEDSKNGNTYSEKDILITQVHDLTGVERYLIESNIKTTTNIIVLGEKVALKKNYNSEKYIATQLGKILNKQNKLGFDVDEFIQKQEEKRGIKLTHQQREFFHNVKNHNVNLLVGYAGCVDRDTEFFDGYGWKKISEYQEGDKVLQYNENGIAELVDPLAYIKLPETKMTLIKNMSGSVNMCLSDEHMVVYKNSNGKITKKQLPEIIKMHKESRLGFTGKFITSFKFNGIGIDLVDEELRVMVMVIADGHFRNETNICRVRVKKERKKIRVRKLLREANIPFVEKDVYSNYTSFTFVSPLRLKEFDSSWYQCSQYQLQIICDEVIYWDGYTNNSNAKIFSTNVKKSAEFIQFAFSSVGYRAIISIQDRVGQKYKDSIYIRKTKEYCVYASTHNLISMRTKKLENKTKLVEITPEDGYKYCFTLPSGMWIMRREGRICVTGNCGKSQMTALLIDLLEELNISYKLTSPTGKAAKVLSNYTNRNAETLHRAIGLGIQQEDDGLEKFIDEEFVIIDEFSMVDVVLGSKLMSKLRHPNVRLLFVGDDFQLPSVSAGRLLYDMMNSNKIPTTKLDIVFRQKEGGILDVATKIRKNERFLKNDDWGIKEFGNNCVIACVPQDKMKGGYQFYYNNLLKEYTSEEITVATPTKKSDLGTVTINKHVQEIVNPYSINKPEKETGFDKVTFRVGDYVLNTKNTYDIYNIDDKKVDIVNGDVGKVISIDMEEKEIVVDFDFTIIPFGFDQIGQLLHCWAMTIHKLQGSSNNAIIVIADKAHKFQLNANLLYTAVTRSVDKLIILSQAETINFAMRKIANQQRNTFLYDMLMEDVGNEVVN